MQLIDYLLIALLVCVCALAVRHIVKKRGSCCGDSESCSGDCTSCTHCTRNKKEE